MERRCFLRLCAGGAVYSVFACIPPVDNSHRRTGSGSGSDPAPATGSEPPAPDMHGSMPQGSDHPVTPPESTPDAGQALDAAPAAPDAGTTSAPDAAPAAPDAEACTRFATMHDTYAQALYFDGTYGPLTGTITVAFVLADQPVTIEFWHGHGGINHQYTVTPEHFAALKRGERVMLETTEVEMHTHQLFIDPTDPEYRVEGSPDVQVPLC